MARVDVETVRSAAGAAATGVLAGLFALTAFAATWRAAVAAKRTGHALLDVMALVMRKICNPDSQRRAPHAPPPDDGDYPCPDFLWQSIALRGGCGPNWAVTGPPSAGKSTFVNTLRGLRARDAGAATVGASETTTEPVEYGLPDGGPLLAGGHAELFRIWDLPGWGTANFPADTYVKNMGLRHFDAVIIITKDSYTEVDARIVQELKKFQVPTFFVRNKVDQDVDNEENDNGVPEQSTLRRVREYVSAFAGVSAKGVYAIAANKVLCDPSRFDCRRLFTDLAAALARAGSTAPPYWEDRHLLGRGRQQYEDNDRSPTIASLVFCCDECPDFRNASIDRVWRNENANLYTSFLHRREELIRSLDLETMPALAPSVPDNLCIDGTSRSVNTVLLWHGTKWDVANTIMSGGFEPRVARVDRNLYGAGVYFSDETCKALQYAQQHNGCLYLLLCRVIVGEPFYVKGRISPTVRRPPCVCGCSDDACAARRYTSVVARRGNEYFPDRVQKHREIIIYDGRLAYPEFLVRFRL